MSTRYYAIPAVFADLVRSDRSLQQWFTDREAVAVGNWRGSETGYCVRPAAGGRGASLVDDLCERHLMLIDEYGAIVDPGELAWA